MLITAKQGTPEWHEARKGKITASIAGACLGLDPYCSRQKAWRLILGTEKERPQNRFQSWGKEHEDKARADYEVLTGQLLHTTGFWLDDEIEWLGASPDSLAGEYGTVEIKCLKHLPDAIPEHHEMQTLIQVRVCKLQWGQYFVWHSLTDYRLFDADTSKIGNIIDRLDDFRKKYVLTGIEPERKNSKRAAS